MKKYIVNGGKKLVGEVKVSGSKNVALKAIVAACLTDDEVEITNVPLISDLNIMLDLVKKIGGEVRVLDHAVRIRLKKVKSNKIPLASALKTRTSSMFLSPLLARSGAALVPNPGGDRIGARPIDRHIKGLTKLGTSIHYNSLDGYFHAKTFGLRGTTYTFDKNTHTGTETLILASALAKGRTILQNAAQEPEIDDLIKLLNSMGAKIKREKRQRTIIIDGVAKLKGVSFEIMSDRNEVVTFGIISALLGGKIFIKNAQVETIAEFLKKFKEAGGEWERKNSRLRFYIPHKLKATTVVTKYHPGFMTDWQGPWAVLMTKAQGISTIHETVFESRFGYVEELKKMGAQMQLYQPIAKVPQKLYNFNYTQENSANKQAVKIIGPTPLHNAVINIHDLRAGATLVIASLIAQGESIIYGVEHIERGYEDFDKRLKSLGADVKVAEEI